MDINRWTKADLEYLLEKLDEGYMILVAGSELGIPTIHDMPSSETVHCGFGVFKTKTTEFTVYFCAGGAMEHTPDGRNSYTTVSVQEGAYQYPFDDVRARLQSVLEDLS